MSETPSTTLENPLLFRGGTPLFNQIETEHVVEGVRSVLADLSARLERLEENPPESWEELIGSLEEMENEMHLTWGPVNHLMGVQNSQELREAHETVLGEVVEFGLRLNQSASLFQAFRNLQDGPAWESLDQASKRVVENRLREAEHAGVGLTGENREEFNRIAQELSRLSVQFSNNVLDATRAFSLTLKDKDEVEGLPENVLRLAAQGYNAIRKEGEPRALPESGPWRVTLDMPSFLPFMQHARRRDLREKIYLEYVQRASRGETDNAPLIGRILKLRRDQARLLGYNTFAELSLKEKMAGTPEKAEELLEQLRTASLEGARRDLEELREIAPRFGIEDELKHWDVAFLAERLREERYEINEEELRKYFPLPATLFGLFILTEKIFGVRVKPADGEAPVWNPDVRYFRIVDENNQPLASFFLDPYTRPDNKRGGAWMDECLPRRVDGEGRVQLPAAYLVCNCSPPMGNQPALMTFREVETLFHEFGHGLQHMLTQTDRMDVAGINGIEWDAVELPSQFMENWCYHQPTLNGFTTHLESGAALPTELFEKLTKARVFRAGSDTLRQVRFALLDLELHHRFDPDGTESVFDAQRRVDEKTTVMPSLPEDRFLCSFQHIFAGGYAAGYYSYKWAEVMSSDAFSAFEEAGLDDPKAIRETGRRFRDTVLALGGSESPEEVFKKFRGREPRPEALLRYSGLISA